MKSILNLIYLSVLVFITACKSYNSSDLKYTTQKSNVKLKPMLAKDNLYREHYDADYSKIYTDAVYTNLCQISISDTISFDKENIATADLRVIKNVKTKGLLNFFMCTAFGLPTAGLASIIGLPIGHSKGIVKLAVDVKDGKGKTIKTYKARARHFSYVTCYWGYKRSDAEAKSLDRAFAKAMNKINKKISNDAAFLNSQLPDGFLSDSEIKANRFIVEGNKSLDLKKFDDAVSQYEKAVAILEPLKSKHSKILQKLGTAYLSSSLDSAVEKSIVYLTRSLDFDPKGDYMIPANLYSAYKYLNDYTNAIKYLDYTLDNFTLNAEQKKLIKSWKEEAQIQEKQLLAGLELKNKPENVTVNNLGPNINGKEADYFPSVTADESLLLFTSRRSGSTGGLGSDGKYDEDLWYSSKASNGDWDAPKNFGPPVNIRNNNAIAAFTGDGQYVVCIRCGELDGVGSCDIYGTSLTGNTWGTPKNLGSVVNSKEWDSQVSISADGKTLVFSSMRTGGKGGEDLWIAKKNEKGEWTSPKNLGSTINTSGSENSPFLHPDGKTLFFSSNNLSPRIGGYDIYKTTLGENGVWSTPVNVGYPINSESDDEHFVLTPSGLKGYFVSTRKGGQGSYDIYEIVYPQEKKSSLITFVGNVLDDDTKLPLEATIKIEDLDSSKLVGEYVSNSATGKFVVILNPGHNYSLTVSKNGYLFYSENFNIPADNEFKEVKKDVFLQPIKEGKKIVLNNIFFQTGKTELTETSVLEIDKLYVLLSQNTEIKVEISGHTDNVGSKSENLRLSQERAVVVVNALIKKGIDASKLTAKGYGDSQPLAPNDTDENKQLNRRTEFKIITVDKK